MNPLIDLSNINLNDYLLAESYINESLRLMTPEEKEIEKLLDKLDELNKDLNSKDITVEKIKELNKLLEELEKKSDKIKDKQVKTFVVIAVISKTIATINTIVSVIELLRRIGKTNNAGESKSFSDILKNVLKETFSLKSLITRALLIINKMIGEKAIIRANQEYLIDKGYEMLINFEAKMMIKKRQAKKNEDKETESSCDKVIAFIEDFKRKREQLKAEAKKQNESTNILFEEYKGNEFKVNTFRIVCRDLGEAIDFDIANLRMYCNSALYITRRALEMNKNNSDKKLESINNKLDSCKEFIEDTSRQRNKTSLQAVFSKYSSMFSNKYSSFGLKVREKFEKKLEDYYIEIAGIMRDYKTSLASIVDNQSDKSIERSTELLENKIKDKVSDEDFNKVKNILSELNNNSKDNMNECKYFLDWAKENLATANIKSSFTYNILNKLFK